MYLSKYQLVFRKNEINNLSLETSAGFSGMKQGFSGKILQLQKEWKPTFPAFAKARKRIETIFSQLCDQFMIIRNYAKDTDGLFARIIGKISALTILQYINYKNEKPIDRVKYALF